MISRFSKVWKLVLSLTALALLLGSASQENASASTQSSPFSALYFEPTSGQTGYHMVSDIWLDEWNSPGGKGCKWTALSKISKGNLPPGLEFDAGIARFEGTPRQAGRWSVSVSFSDIHCTDGRDQSIYGPVTVRINFNIKP